MSKLTFDKLRKLVKEELFYRDFYRKAEENNKEGKSNENYKRKTGRNY